MLKKLFNNVMSFAENLAADYNDREEKSKSGGKESLKKGDSSFNEDARQQSLRSSQEKTDFSGSSYNGPGNVDREKRHSNMSQRNF